MKNKKAFTLMELIVSIFMITVFALFIAICVINVKYANESNDLMTFLYPEVAKAQAQQDLAREIAEQNRLMREQMAQQKKQNQ